VDSLVINVEIARALLATEAVVRKLPFREVGGDAVSLAPRPRRPDDERPAGVVVLAGSVNDFGVRLGAFTLPVPDTAGRQRVVEIDVDPLFGTFRLREEFHGGGLLETFLVDYQYLLIGVVFVLAVVFINRLRKSPYGLIFRAIRENEGRVPDVGLNVWRYKFAAYVISGGVVGLGGGLLTIESAFAGLRSMYWVTSGEIVIMTVLGGIGTLFGPVLGVVIFLYFKNVVNGLPTIGPYWLIILATVFTAIIWIYPDGIWGAIKQGAATVRSLVED